MIFLHKPYIKQKKNRSQLVFDIDIDKDKKSVFFEVDKKYEKFLCADRVDAIVVGLLQYAMLNNHDIKSDSYITEEILFKINNYLLPSLTKYSTQLSNINIDIETTPTCENIGAVGTGCSCGIDSLHAYIKHKDEKNNQFKLTHLCINNVGAFNETYKEAGIEKIKKERYKKAKKFADEVGLPLITTDSNFLDEIYQVHYNTHTYSSTFAILCLQKLWGTYYYGSSGMDFSHFNIKDTAEKDSAEYELLSLDCFSTRNLKIFSEGGAYDRFEKTKFIYQNSLVKKHLHVCIKEAYNCNVCDKCMRTMLTLYALKANLKEYEKVFDYKYFEQHIEEYFKWLYEDYLWNPHSMMGRVYELLLDDEKFKEYLRKNNKIHSEELENKIDYKEAYEKVINSRSFKLGNKILIVPRKIKRMLKKDNN